MFLLLSISSTIIATVAVGNHHIIIRNIVIRRRLSKIVEDYAFPRLRRVEKVQIERVIVGVVCVISARRYGRAGVQGARIVDSVSLRIKVLVT